MAATAEFVSAPRRVYCPDGCGAIVLLAPTKTRGQKLGPPLVLDVVELVPRHFRDLGGTGRAVLRADGTARRMRDGGQVDRRPGDACMRVHACG